MSDNKLQKIDVFISSPSDVQAERDAIVEIIGEINEMPSVRDRYVLKPLAYERIVPPEVGEKPQKVVDKYMREAGKADLFIGVLWARMGTPVVDDDGTEYQSGTEYEFRKAYEARTSARGKPIMLQYRCIAEKPDVDPEQKARVDTFFKRFEGDGADFKGLYKAYKTVDAFRGLLRKHLLEVMEQITPDADDMQPAAPVHRRVEHYRHIPLPTNYVERTDLLAELRKALIGATPDMALTSEIKSASARNPTALHGMGGIGKSVMARALCEDPQVQAAFPDGILWATCGQTPNLIQQLREWIKAFNEIPDDKAELSGLQAHVARMLADRACLLIVDDVWEKQHADAFRVGGVRCRTIITTRDEVIADELGAKVERIPLMSETDAISLLELWAKERLTSVPHDIKAKIVNRVGRLALAIKLAGGLLTRQTPEQWLEGFDIHKLRSRRPDSNNPHDSLEACFGLSLAQLTSDERRCYAALSIFREDETIVEQAVVKLWDTFADCDPSTTGDVIDDLAARALLEITQTVYPRAFVLHDLLREMTHAELGTERKAAHEALIAAYAETKTGEGWHTAPHDGYLYTHLAYHLHEVGWKEELYQLLTDSPAWMEAKYLACVGDRAYVDDLELAISDFHDPLTADQVLMLTKLCTARQVVNARVSSYKDIDLKTLVWMGRTQEAETHARLRQDAKERVEGVMAIYRAQRERKAADIRLLDQALYYARTIEDASSRADALRDIAAALAQAGSIDKALTTARTIENVYSRADALRAIAAALATAGQPAQATFDKALTTARTIEYAYSRTHALRDIAAALANAGQPAQATFDEALTTARTIENADYSGYRAALLREIAVALANAGYTDKALTTARTIEDVSARAAALRAIAAALATARQPAQATFDEALATARTIENADYRASVLRDIATDLATAGRTDEALMAARMIENVDFRTHALCVIAVALANAGQPPQATFDEALATARTIATTSNRAAALREIAAALATAGRTDEALTTARTIENVYFRAAALRDIATALATNGQPAQATFDEALTTARTIENAYSRTDTLRDIAAALATAGQSAQAVFDEALTTARTVESAYSRANALRDIAAALATAGRTDEALTTARTIGANDYRAIALRAIATALAATGRTEEAMATARTIEDASSRAAALRDIATALATTGQPAQAIFDEALTTARTIADVDYRAAALRDIATALATTGQPAQSTFDEALMTARTMGVNDYRAAALRDIATALAATGRTDEALATARTIEDASSRAAALREIASALVTTGQPAQATFDEALTTARTIAAANYHGAAVLRDIATAFAKIHKFAQAWDVVGLRDELAEYVSSLSEWREGLEKAEIGLTLKVLREATRIVAWEKPRWEEIHRILVEATKDK
ncbi:MAG: DUF4062 domain-containing protein [Anaerolineae bacterium]|nr:DUF4062 domain-containing protein [Anaerolineae bacterium]